jgi:GH15 family glucan-1,4-alpha-glucosidase
MLTCVAGLKAAAGVAPTAQASAWTGLADEILAHCARTSVHPSGRWQRTSTDPRVDAALLMPGIRGALPPQDPRTTATLAAVLDELTDDGYVYRYRADNRSLGDAEGAFLLCGFATSLATHRAGDRVDAVRWFERARSACGPAGLYGEEYDIHQRQLRGNLPQAFVHALLLECAVRLSA